MLRVNGVSIEHFPSEGKTPLGLTIRSRGTIERSQTESRSGEVPLPAQG